MSNEPDPWSTDQPVAPGPVEFVFAESAESDGLPHFESDGAPQNEPPVRVDAARSRRWFVSAGVVGLAVVGLVAASLARGSTSDSTETIDSTATAPTTSVEELPDVTTMPPTTAESMTTTPPTVVDAAQQTADEQTPEWIDGRVVVPDRFEQFAVDTQFVALSTRGLVVEVDLASATTSTINLDQRRTSAQMYARGPVTLITNDGGPPGIGPVLVEQGSPPINVEIPGTSNGFTVIGSDSNVGAFRVEAYNSVGSSLFAVLPDGSVREIEESFDRLLYGQYEMTTGEWLVADAGDLFLISPPGVEPPTSRRISTGQMIGRSAQTVFVNECSEARECGQFLIDVDTLERTEVPLGDDLEFFNLLQAVSMAPDGKAVLVQSDQNNEAFFVDLTTGDRVDVPFSLRTNFGRSASTWVPDGSGIVTARDGDITFVDRLTGEVTELPLEFGDADGVLAVHARPAATT